mmetsp:Transcript_40785/g.115675  ORF Transcript_40785/g.115675 Transcript_40785/m.115675 type:complete len:225 (+) Transcript_40785:318-992(+)
MRAGERGKQHAAQREDVDFRADRPPQINVSNLRSAVHRCAPTCDELLHLQDHTSLSVREIEGSPTRRAEVSQLPARVNTHHQVLALDVVVGYLQLVQFCKSRGNPRQDLKRLLLWHTRAAHCTCNLRPSGGLPPHRRLQAVHERAPRAELEERDRLHTSAPRLRPDYLAARASAWVQTPAPGLGEWRFLLRIARPSLCTRRRSLHRQAVRPVAPIDHRCTLAVP